MKSFLEELKRNEKIYLKDSGTGFLSFFLSNLKNSLKRPLFYIDERENLFDIYENLNSLGIHPFLLEENNSYILNALVSLVRGVPSIYLIDSDFLKKKVISPDKIKTKIFSIKKGDTGIYNNLISFLEREGYRRTDFIYDEGDFSVRGEVIDVFSLRPVRIYFDLEEVKHLKIIDVEKQRSLKEINSSEIFSINFEGEEEFLNYLKNGDTVQRKDEIRVPGRVIILSSLGDFDFNVIMLPSFKGNIDFLFKEIEQFLNQNFDVFVFVQDEKDIPVIREILEARDIRSSFFNYRKGFFSQSFVSNYLRILVLTDRDILGMVLPKRKIKKVRVRIDFEHEDFKEGDYVVHEEYGIGLYRGIKTFEIKDKRTDYFLIEYAKGDKLYVPVEDISFVKKYTSFSDSPPSIYPLEGSSWRRLKNRVEREIDEFVISILNTEAKRRMADGISFKEKEEEKIFAMEFPYEETEDQRKAIEDVLNLMEKPQPMEHLVCGDVGFGKTEVAMRASFRAVWNNKQVLLFSPTTILTEQHYINFKERFKNFPVNIKAVSRLSSKKEFKEILDGVEKGTVDILIGTHRILNERFRFKDLGLLIIDEEHRFGVEAKEKIKMKYPYIDVLYLSATPIPRTLAMALEGIKTFSLINTPPQGRKPVRIYIRNYDMGLIEEAIRREILRGGQVFYVHNDISSIMEEKKKIEKIFPDVLVDVIHGRLSGRRIEEIMLDFYKGRIKILVATTIIESGLDIPNVNTLIVNNAYEFGLAQIYQLRGRVGRGLRVAYCFFLYPKEKKLSEKSVKRIEAMINYSEPGSGFSLAMKDLEIRGAGNFLTKKQHGAVKKLGMELYLKILKKSMNKFSKEITDIKSLKTRILDVDIDGFENYYIPEEFISVAEERVFYYRIISEAENEKQLMKIKEDLEDKFGNLPLPVINLFELQYLRILSASKDVKKIIKRDKAYTVILEDRKIFFKDKNSLIYFLKNV